MQQDALTLYKLIILFMLDKVDFPLTNAQISDFILEMDYTNYFNIQQAISELIDAEFISSETVRNSSYLKITAAGREVLGFCDNDISEAIKNDTLAYLKKHKFELRNEVSTISTYYEAKKDVFITQCFVKEADSNLIELNLNVVSEKEAETICKNWKDKSQEIYAYLIQTLLAE